MNKQKIKEFWREHKPVIIGTVCAIGACGASYLIGQGVVSRRFLGLDSRVVNTCLHADTIYGPNLGIYRDITHNYKPSELGKLGADMISVGVPENQILTHFLAFGKYSK